MDTITYIFSLLLFFMVHSSVHMPTGFPYPSAIDLSLATNNVYVVRPDNSSPTSEVDSILFTIGVIDGDDNEVFGSIHDIAVDPAGNIFILDNQTLMVSWFDSTGQYQDRIGGYGGGPGQFRAPVAIAIGPDGKIHVLDQAHRKVFVLGMNSGELIQTTTVDIAVLYPHDFCITEESEYIVFSPEPHGVIHRTSSDGHIRSSFGDMITEETVGLTHNIEPSPKIARLFRDNLNRGRMACGAGKLVVAYESLPIVRAYQESGEKIWETELTDFHAMRWEITREGRGLRRGANARTQTAHTIMDVMIDDLGVVLSLRETSLADIEGEIEIRSLSFEDGRQRWRTVGSLLLGATSRGIHYGHSDYPYPRVTAFRRSLGEP